MYVWFVRLGKCIKIHLHWPINLNYGLHIFPRSKRGAIYITTLIVMKGLHVAVLIARVFVAN